MQPAVATSNFVPQPKTESLPSYPLYVGLYDYYKQIPEDLDLKEGDLVYIINKQDNGRWFAHMKDSGKEGYIPSNYVDAKYNKE